jgi:hypothetical protein
MVLLEVVQQFSDCCRPLRLVKLWSLEVVEVGTTTHTVLDVAVVVERTDSTVKVLSRARERQTLWLERKELKEWNLLLQATQMVLAGQDMGVEEVAGTMVVVEAGAMVVGVRVLSPRREHPAQLRLLLESQPRMGI